MHRLVKDLLEEKSKPKLRSIIYAIEVTQFSDPNDRRILKNRLLEVAEILSKYDPPAIFLVSYKKSCLFI